MFAASTMCMTTGGGFADGFTYHEVPIITKARKKRYKDLGQIFGASSVVNELGDVISATRLIPGVRSGMNYGSFVHNLVEGNLNLFLYGCIQETQVMNLFIGGRYLSTYAALPLTLYNEAIYNTMMLFTSGYGTEDGAIPENASLNLFIQRNYANYLMLSLLGGPQPSSTGYINLFLLGGERGIGTLPLSLPNTSDTDNATLKLYTHGF